MELEDYDRILAEKTTEIHNLKKLLKRATDQFWGSSYVCSESNLQKFYQDVRVALGEADAHRAQKRV